MIVDDLGRLSWQCSTVCAKYLTDMSFFVYHGSVRRNNDMEANRDIGVVINGRITMGCLGFTYTPVSTV